MFSKNSINFLNELRENNNKEWFENNRKAYDNLRNELIQFSSEIIKEISKWDDGYANLDPKKCLFRINRDVRFSKDKSPYKTNMGAWFSKGGKDWVLSGYYFHLEPDKSFIAAGSYEPMPEQLKLIRQEIDYNLEEFQSILNKKEFKTCYGNMSGRGLKTIPKGYDKDNPAIDYLRFKDFIVTKNLAQESLMSENLTALCVSSFKAASGFNNFLDRAVSV